MSYVEVPARRCFIVRAFFFRRNPVGRRTQTAADEIGNERKTERRWGEGVLGGGRLRPSDLSVTRKNVKTRICRGGRRVGRRMTRARKLEKESYGTNRRGGGVYDFVFFYFVFIFLLASIRIQLHARACVGIRFVLFFLLCFFTVFPGSSSFASYAAHVGIQI